jgi:hypothetical protein
MDSVERDPSVNVGNWGQIILVLIGREDNDFFAVRKGNYDRI